MTKTDMGVSSKPAGKNPTVITADTMTRRSFVSRTAAVAAALVGTGISVLFVSEPISAWADEAAQTDSDGEIGGASSSTDASTASNASSSSAADAPKPAKAIPNRGDADSNSRVQYAFWVDTRLCDGCSECVNACRANCGTPDDVQARRWVREFSNTFGDIRYVSESCMHCDVPACATVCPAHAITKRDDGIVVVDDKRCIGCKYCFQACPYAMPHYTSKGMDKCDFCIGCGIEPGNPPHCVQACEKGALRFGTLDELMEISGKRAQPISGSTGPHFYIS